MSEDLAALHYEDIADGRAGGQRTTHGLWNPVLEMHVRRLIFSEQHGYVVLRHRLDAADAIDGDMNRKRLSPANQMHLRVVPKAPIEQLGAFREALGIRRRPEYDRNKPHVAALGGRRQIEARMDSESGLQPVAARQMAD